MPVSISASSKGTSEAIAYVIGYGAEDASSVTEGVAAKVAADELPSPQVFREESGVVILAKPQPKPHLVGNEDWRILGKDILASCKKAGAKSLRIVVDAPKDEVTALVEGIAINDWKLPNFFMKKKGKDAAKPLKITIPGQGAAVKAGLDNAQAQNLAREFCDLPGNHMNPSIFVRKARAALKGLPLSISVIQGVDKLTEAGFPGLCQVGGAGSAPPALLTITWKGKAKAQGKAKAKNKGPQLAIVGKGITFDSGGISLKPGAGMWEMKGDMGGAAAVLGAMQLIGKRQPKTPVTAYCVLAENMPDSNAQRPGDIYQARNGKHIHVDNTDAEGRLVLSDVLTYACENGATHVVDAATLTGACLVALGTGVAGLMSNNDDWAGAVRGAGQDVGEELWQLPLYEEYKDLLKHPHADLNNIGGRFAGTITAGLFLQEFVDEKVKWAHLDIAGPAMRGAGDWRYFTKGATGFGVRTFAHLPEIL